jgi:hypothetical protein
MVMSTNAVIDRGNAILNQTGYGQDGSKNNVPLTKLETAQAVLVGTISAQRAMNEAAKSGRRPR